MATPLKLVVKAMGNRFRMIHPKHSRKEENANQKATPVSGRAIIFLLTMTRLHLPLAN
jgi:hypothetical protein